MNEEYKKKYLKYKIKYLELIGGTFNIMPVINYILGTQVPGSPSAIDFIFSYEIKSIQQELEKFELEIQKSIDATDSNKLEKSIVDIKKREFKESQKEKLKIILDFIKGIDKKNEHKFAKEKLKLVIEEMDRSLNDTVQKPTTPTQTTQATQATQKSVLQQQPQQQQQPPQQPPQPQQPQQPPQQQPPQPPTPTGSPGSPAVVANKWKRDEELGIALTNFFKKLPSVEVDLQKNIEEIEELITTIQKNIQTYKGKSTEQLEKKIDNLITQRNEKVIEVLKSLFEKFPQIFSDNTELEGERARFISELQQPPPQQQQPPQQPPQPQQQQQPPQQPPQPQQQQQPPQQPPPQQQLGAKTGITIKKIKNLFKLLQDIINKNDENVETAVTEMNKNMPKDIYSEDEKRDFLILNIAKCIGMDEDSDYITNIKEYIKNNFIKEIFKGDQLYKLFIFIVIEFGKQFNLEGPVITRMEKLLIDPPLNLQVI
jgi:hypothetical protein